MSDKLKILFNNIQKMVDEGSTEKYAISVVCRKLNMNPNLIYDKYFKDKESSNDTKNKPLNVGSYVILSKNGKQYEVINIIDNDNILLRDTDNNEQITASEKEITPVIMENRMTNLNEAQYNLSIDGLSTEDAETLSQMLSLAGQAENSMPMTDPMSTPMEAPMDISSEENMNIDVPSEETIPFDEELPMDSEIPSGEQSVDDMNDVSDDELSELDNTMGFDPEENTMDMTTDDMMDGDMMESDLEEDLLLPKEDADPTNVAQDESFDEEIEETLKVAGIQLDEGCNKKIEEVEEMVPSEEELEECGVNPTHPQDKFAEEITEADDEDDDVEHYETCAWCGEDLPKSELKKEKDLGYLCHHCIKGLESREGDLDFEEDLEEGSFDNIKQKVKDAMPKAGTFRNVNDKIEGVFFGNGSNELLDAAKEMAYKLHLQGKNVGYISKKEVEDYIARGRKLEDEKIEESFVEDIKDSFDEEIEESLRNAGIIIDETKDGVKGIIPTKDSAQDSVEEYEVVDTDTFGQEASEGMKKPLTVESVVKTNKIKNIFETAQHMYARKDKEDWDKLDRRYVEKLIKEGCSYSRACKMLDEAKKRK